MQRKPLIAVAAAALFALPLAAMAGTDKATASKSSSSATAGNDGGAEAMFKSMDKNNDGFISKDEAANTPHAANFDQLDKDKDGKLSRAEHANAPEHVAGRKGDKTAAKDGAAAGAKSGSQDSATQGTKKSY